MKTEADKVFEEIVRTNINVLREYEKLMQIYYKGFREEGGVDETLMIPKAQVKALMAMLEHCGYRVSKKPKLVQVNGNNLVQFKRA